MPEASASWPQMSRRSVTLGGTAGSSASTAGMLSADSSGTSMNANRQSRPASMPPENVNSTLAAPEQAAKVATAAGRRPGAASTWM